MKKTMLAISAAGLMSLIPLAMASQHPDAQQRVALDAVLTKAGFVSWGEIELKKDYWEVEDARKELGAVQKYDLRLDPKTLKVLQEKLDD